MPRSVLCGPFYVVTPFRAYVALFLLDFLAEQGTAFNGNESAPDAEGRARLLALVERALRTADVQGTH